MQEEIRLLAEKCTSQDKIGQELQEKYEENEREMNFKMEKLKQELEHLYGAQ